MLKTQPHSKAVQKSSHQGSNNHRHFDSLSSDRLHCFILYIGNFSEVVVHFLLHCWSKQAIALQTSISCPPAPVSIELIPIPTLNYLDCHLCIFNVPVSFFLLCCSEILLSLLIFYTFHLVSGSKVLNYRFLYGAKT